MRTSVILILSLVFMSNAASGFAADSTGRDQEYQQRIAELAQRLTEQRAAIEGGEATIEEIDEYCSTALWLVYTSKVYANYTFGADVQTTNDDLDSLVELGYLPLWPGNPVNGWEPMRVLTPADDYSACDLCFAPCPPDYYTKIKTGLAALAFDIFIYSPVESHAQFGSITQSGTNKDWSTPPAGAMYGLSFYAQSDKQYQEQLRKYREKKKGSS